MHALRVVVTALAVVLVCGAAPKHTKLSVSVNVKAIVQRILSRYPAQHAMFREMIQNANDGEIVVSTAGRANIIV
jgi:hypothetical protein